MTFPPMYVASKNVFGKPRTCRDLPRTCQATERLLSVAEFLWPWSVAPRSSKGGGAAVVPPWGSSIFLVQEAADQICHHRSAGA